MAGRGKLKLLVVCGPTATGKTELALALCRRFAGELVGADSMQIYRGLTVGTAAPTPAQTGDITTHLIGCLPPEQAFSVAEYVAQAGKALEDIQARGALPVLCGGTGLYIDSLLGGIRFEDEEEKATQAVLEQLGSDGNAEGGPALLARLAEVDPKHAASLNPQDRRRILRSLVLWQQTGRTREERDADSRWQARQFRPLWLGLKDPDRNALYARIDARVDAMLTAGLPAEAEMVYQNRARYRTAAQAIGYKELFGYIEGKESLEQAAEKLKQATRRYAKRQLTWFRRNGAIQWLNPADPELLIRAEQLAEGFLASEA